MRAYEIFLNGKRLCVAGIRSDGYISAYVTYRSDPKATWIDIVGLDSAKKRYVRWKQTNLRSGDEILLRIVDRKSVDEYKIIGRLDVKKNLESMKRDVMAKALGLKIREKHKARKHALASPTRAKS